jgi:hypothetical protein
MISPGTVADIFIGVGEGDEVTFSVDVLDLMQAVVALLVVAFFASWSCVLNQHRGFTKTDAAHES